MNLFIVKIQTISGLTSDLEVLKLMLKRLFENLSINLQNITNVFGRSHLVFPRIQPIFVN